MTREEFIKNFIASEGAVILPESFQSADLRVILSLIGSIYDQQEMIEYLDNRVIDLERIVYSRQD